ncbi:TSUP family transporter [Polynucleobacter antarcticus]|uniref:TSUP family transporter n=1 Tax=Polynucleobacter antarcticus TaxID=1743162 RepID=UPI00156EB9B1|nr:TSUP family transporter [Polynucleobacter antarcticus]
MHVLFLCFVAIAVYAQTLTGFALSFILLGLITLIDLVPLIDTVNIISVILVLNSIIFLYKRWPLQFEKSLFPSLATSLISTLAGMGLLIWLVGTTYEIARLLLGISICICALLLWKKTKSLSKESSPWIFAIFGSISGLLGGLFSAPGPPFVYLMYRQPWTASRILESLIFFFGVITLFRLLVSIAANQFSMNALLLTIEAIPVVYAVTAFSASRPPPLTPSTIKSIVCGLLGVIGASMAVTSAVILSN